MRGGRIRSSTPIVAIVVGVLLGAMALFLAAINRRLLIDTSDPELDRAARSVARARAASRARCARSCSTTISAVVFVRAETDLRRIVRARRGAEGALRRRRRQERRRGLLEIRRQRALGARPQSRMRQAVRPRRRRMPHEPQDGAAISARIGSAARFIVSQPVVDTSAPDASDETPIVANTMKSLSPCVRAFSTGPVGLGQQRRAARVHEIPADADERQRGDEMRDRDCR